MTGFGDTMLLDLFREEVRTHTQVLSDGLVGLEQDPNNAKKIEPLMRAAHSIKGAARVINLEPAVRLAHAMEDLLVRSQKGELTLSSEGIDVLLEAVDVLKEMASEAGAAFQAWFDSHCRALEQLHEKLQGVSSPSAAPAARSTPTPPQPQPPESAPKPVATASEQEAGVVRVTAGSLTRLMGLAGESLVEARWLQPFSKSLLELKTLQGRLTETLDDLHDAAVQRESWERAAELIFEGQRQLAECRNLLLERIGEFDNRIRRADDLSSRLYQEVISSRMRPFRDGVQGFPRMVRDVARQLGKRVELEILGQNTEVDRDILEKLEAPLNHLLRNALDHGLESLEDRVAAGKPETGRLRVEARHRAGMLSILVADDGRGIDLEMLRAKVVQRGHVDEGTAARLASSELLAFLFLPGFSTASKVTELSGRGFGLDVVHTMVHSVGGDIHIQSELGKGTEFLLELPVTLSVLRAVLVEIAGEPYAFPHHRIDRLVHIGRADLHSAENCQYFSLDGRNIGVVQAQQIFGFSVDEQNRDDHLVVLFSDRSEEYGLVVDGLLGEQDLVVRPLDPRLGKVPTIHAAAILDDGSPVLIIDLEDLRHSIRRLLQETRLQRIASGANRSSTQACKRILVVDDSITVREVQRQLLANRGYSVEVAVDGMEGWSIAREGRFDLVITDVDMPRMDGVELVRRLRADARMHAIPVVIVSYKDREEDRLKGLEAGANYYLTKSSFHDETLVQAVIELIGEPQP